MEIALARKMGEISNMLGIPSKYQWRMAICGSRHDGARDKCPHAASTADETKAVISLQETNKVYAVQRRLAWPDFEKPNIIYLVAIMESDEFHRCYSPSTLELDR